MNHNLDELRIRFHSLLETLCDRYSLDVYIGNNEPEDVYNNWGGYDAAAEELNIWCATGATKFVIGDDNCDYIIKIQPPCVDDNVDYCAREVEVYNAAVVNGYEDKFAWTAKLFDYDFNESICLPVYVMEWCQCSYDMIDDEMDNWHYTNYCSSHCLEMGDEAYDKYNSAPDGRERNYSVMMLEWAFEMWGGEYTEDNEFVQFMRNMYINDIHAGNWGWCNNRLVLTDYSGYGEYVERDIDY